MIRYIHVGEPLITELESKYSSTIRPAQWRPILERLQALTCVPPELRVPIFRHGKQAPPPGALKVRASLVFHFNPFNFIGCMFRLHSNIQKNTNELIFAENLGFQH